SAAVTSGVDAVHPGYGFLAENPELARACTQAGIVFIGPTEEQLAAVGDKLAARDHAVAAGLSVVPGAEVGDATAARELAGEIGYPSPIMAVGGVGGLSLKPLYVPDRLTDTVAHPSSEARTA